MFYTVFGIILVLSHELIIFVYVLIDIHLYFICYVYVISFIFSHFADTFIQSDLQMRVMEAIKINKSVVLVILKQYTSRYFIHLLLLLYNTNIIIYWPYFGRQPPCCLDSSVKI